MSKRVSFVVMFMAILDLLAFTAVLPFFPKYVEDNVLSQPNDTVVVTLQSVAQYLNMPEGHRLHYVFLGGCVGSILSFGSFLGGPMMGTFSDVFGRKPVLIMCSVLAMVACIIPLVVNEFVMFTFSRFLMGVAKSNTGIFITMMADLSNGNQDERRKNVAMIGAAYAIGFLFGPPFAVLVCTYLGKGEIKPNMFALILNVITLLFTLRYVPETKSTAPKQPSSTNRPSNHVIHVFYFLFLFLYSGAEMSLTFFLHDMVHASSRLQSVTYVVIGITMIVIQGGYVRRTKATSSSIAFQGLLSFPAGVALLILASQNADTLLPYFYGGTALMGFASATVVSALTAMALQGLQDHETGNATGLLRSAGHLARSLGPVISMATYAALGPEWYFDIVGMIAAVTASLYYFVLHQRRQPKLTKQN
eukprot:PhF_6_TR27838/c0_g1_i2/m.40622